MKYKVIGWTDGYDYDTEQAEITWAAKNAIIDEVIAKDYCFSGYDHQEGYSCTPVLNDGKKREFSRRGWGDVMAEANGMRGPYDYAVFTDDVNPEYRKVPDNSIDTDLILSPEELAETITVSVDKETFESAKTEDTVTLKDLPELRYAEKTDTIVFVCGGEKISRVILDVDRKRDIPPDRLTKLKIDMSDNDREVRRRARDEIAVAPDRVILTLVKQ